MLSFIIIGRNEGWKLTKCLDSVFLTIERNKLSSYEIIYIDSNSTDDSIERILSFQEVKIFKLTNDCNAAIARNIGAKEASGDTLFFLDGDMEIVPKDFSQFYTEKNGLAYPFVSGDLDNYYYSHDWQFLRKDGGLGLKNDIKKSTVGGLFLIRKSLWESIGGMRNEFKRSQDIDLGLRLAKRGYLLLRKNSLLAHHHMISYLDKKRKWELLLSGADLYGRSYLYRTNIFNKYCWKRIIRNDYSIVCLLISVVLTISLSSIVPVFAYLAILLPKTIKTQTKRFSNFFYFLVRDIVTVLGFVFFWPAVPRNTKYSTINDSPVVHE